MIWFPAIAFILTMVVLVAVAWQFIRPHRSSSTKQHERYAANQ